MMLFPNARAWTRGALAGAGLALLAAAGCGQQDRRSQERTAEFAPEARAVFFPAAGPVVVEATGREFLWRFRYPGADGAWDTADDVRLDRELHLPADADVVLLVKSDDYLYTFLSPELGLRRVAVPELTRRLEFRTSSPGVYELATDPMCGAALLHEGPMGRMIVESAAESLAESEQTVALNRSAAWAPSKVQE